MGELATTKKALAQKEEDMQQLEERLQRLETTHTRQPKERRWEQRKASRTYSHYGSQEEEQEWRMHQYDERRHPHQPSKFYFPFIKLPSFNGESDPNVYLGWEVKVEQIFNLYEVQDDQKVKLTSLHFLDYAMPWWHQFVMDIRLNKRSTVVSWTI